MGLTGSLIGVNLEKIILSNSFVNYFYSLGVFELVVYMLKSPCITYDISSPISKESVSHCQPHNFVI